MLSRPAAGPCSPKTENARGENSGARIPCQSRCRRARVPGRGHSPPAGVRATQGETLCREEPAVEFSELKKRYERDTRSGSRQASRERSRHCRAFFQGIEALSGTPVPFGVRRLRGAEHLYRIRVGDYRIVYAVDHAVQEVIILYVRAAVHTVGCDPGQAAPVLPRHREKSTVPVSAARRARGLPSSLTV